MKLDRKVIICTHGKFGEELLKSAEMIVGNLPSYKAYSLLPGMDPQDLKTIIESDLNPDEDVLCLVDVFGGSPSTLTAILSQTYKLTILAGVNLPMLLELSNASEDKTNEELSQDLIDTTRGACINVLEFMRKGREA